MAAKTYKVLQKSFINGDIVNPGDIVSLPYGTEPGTALEEVGGKDVEAVQEASAEENKPWPEQPQDRTPAFGKHPLQDQGVRVILAAEATPEEKKAADEATRRNARVASQNADEAAMNAARAADAASAAARREGETQRQGETRRGSEQRPAGNEANRPASKK